MKQIGSLTIKRDGNMFFARLDDFTNLQESPAGFGSTIEEAVNDLAKNSNRSLDLCAFSLTGR